MARETRENDAKERPLSVSSICSGSTFDRAAWNNVRRPEWPAKAAAMVVQAKPGEREALAREIIKAAHVAIPRALPVVVSALAAAVPELASVVATAASQWQPEDAPLFARAAAAAAPGEAGKIVLRVCRETPAEFAEIALAADEVAPARAQEILGLMAEAVPVIQLIVNAGLIEARAASVPGARLVPALIGYAERRFELAATARGLTRAQALSLTQPLPPPPPILGPPYRPPLAGTVTIIGEHPPFCPGRCCGRRYCL